MTMLLTKPAVIVAYYGGADVLSDLRHRGYDPVRVQLFNHDKHNQFLIQYLAKDESNLSDVIVQNEHDSIESLADKLSMIGVTHIIPADEAGVELSDLLAHYLKLPFNGMAFSKARRNKALMHQALDSKGVVIPLQTIVSNIGEFRDWVNQHNATYPFVVKPLNGAGSAGVTKCFNESDVQAAFHEISKIVSRKNTVASIAEQFIVQEFLEGVEYVVDTVSLSGQHKLIDVWKCVKGAHNSAAFVYEYFDLIHQNDSVCPILFNYTKSVLDALDVTIGPAHSEVYIRHNGQPTLVETGFRLGGPRMPFGTAQCVASRKAQTEYAIDAYIEPSKFSDEWDDSYQMTKHCRMVFLIHYDHIKLNGFNDTTLDQIKRLESYNHIEFSVVPGDYLQKTIDVRSSPGFIYLIHDDPAQIAFDYEVIRQLEKSLFN